MGDKQEARGEAATASSPSAAGLADCSEAVCAALRQLQEGYAAAQVRVQELQEQKAALKADARRMAEHLFGELSASQEREAQLAAEVEQLRALQAELAEAAAAEAESCRSGVQDAKAAEAQALGRVAALEQELQQAREMAHRLEVELQDGRARAVVDKEAWQAQSDKLHNQLEAAEATAAAQRQSAELWQRKHGLLEDQLNGMQAQQEEKHTNTEKLQLSLKQAEAQARDAHLVAKSFRQAVASSLQDLSDLCSALQTAQAAMAADSSSKPAYLQALSLIQSSLVRVAGAAEAALSSVGNAAAVGPGVHSGSRGACGFLQAATLQLDPQQQHPQQEQEQQTEVQQGVHALLQGSSGDGASAPSPPELQLHSGSARGDGHSAASLELPDACHGSANPPVEGTHAGSLGRDGQGYPQEEAQPATADVATLATSLHRHQQQQQAQQQQQQAQQQERDLHEEQQQPLGEAPPSFIQACRAKHGRPRAAGRPKAASAPDLASRAVEGSGSRPASPTCKRPLTLPAGKQQQRPQQQLARDGPQHPPREETRPPRPARASAAADLGNAGLAAAAAAPPAARPARHGSGPRAEASPPLRHSPEHVPDLPTSRAVGVGQRGLTEGLVVASQPGLGAQAMTQLVVSYEGGVQQGQLGGPVAAEALAPGQVALGRRRAPAAASAALPAAAAAAAACLAGGGAAFGGTRDSLTAVIMSVEDELATLDLRHAALLKQSAALREAKALPGDVSVELQREEVAGVMRSVREAMQRKGQQLAQLKQYRDLVGAAR
ncbi:hypothetical protein N2152v2_006800 [Parachlorella kessleri]